MSDRPKRRDLIEANLEGLDLSFLDFSFTDFDGANLCQADLRHADLHAADFTAANCIGVAFNRANLIGATFDGAALDDATLQGADLRAVEEVAHEPNEKAKALVILGNEAKDNRDYALANLCWVGAMEFVEHRRTFAAAFPDEDPDNLSVYFGIETNDPEGDGESYYDLLVLTIGNETDHESLSIPLPMVKREGISTFTRYADRIPRRQHNRQSISLDVEKRAGQMARYRSLTEFFIRGYEHRWLRTVPDTRT